MGSLFSVITEQKTGFFFAELKRNESSTHAYDRQS